MPGERLSSSPAVHCGRRGPRCMPGAVVPGASRQHGGAAAASAAAAGPASGSGGASRRRRRLRGAPRAAAASPGGGGAPAAGPLRAAGGRAGAGLRPGPAVPPVAAAAQREPAEPDESGCSELHSEHKYRQWTEKRRWASAEGRQDSRGVLCLVRSAGVVPAPGLRVPLAELRQCQALPDACADGHQARRGPGREPALHPVPQHDQVSDLLCQGHPQCPLGVLQQDHRQGALPRGLVARGLLRWFLACQPSCSLEF